MKRKELEDLGLTKEQVDVVIKMNGADIENAKGVNASEIANLKAENDALSNQIQDRDKQIDTLKISAGDNEELKKQIEALQTENKTKDEAHAKELERLKIDAAVEKALTEGGAKSVKAAKALLELSEAKLSEDGSIKGLSEQIEKIKKDDSTKFLFEETKQEHSFAGFQPGNSGIVPNSKQAGYETRLAEARKNNNQLEVIKIKQEAFQNDQLVLM